MKVTIAIEEILEFFNRNKFEYEFEGNKNDVVRGFSSLFNYKENSMTFISTLYNFDQLQSKFKNKQIQLIITSYDEKIYPEFNNVIKVKKPTYIFFMILEEFFDEADSINLPISEKNYIKHSFVSKDAIIGDNVKIGIGCVVEGNVKIGDNTVIHHNVVIRQNTKIGKNCEILSGTIIGESGFNPNTLNDGSRKLLKHYGGVTIEDDVHIGDNCSIARGTIDDTVIKKGVKLNSLIRVAHNSVIGENTVVTMPTFICGSVKIGKNCHIAASVIKNQCNVGDEAVLGLGAVVVKDVKAGEIVVGNPAKPMKR